MSRPRWLVLVLGTICLLEAAILAWRAAEPPPEITLPTSATAAKPLDIARLVMAAPPDPQQFAEVSARPLFRPDRRPQQVAAVPPPPASNNTVGTVGVGTPTQRR